MIHIESLNLLLSNWLRAIYMDMSLHSVAFNDKKEPNWLGRWACTWNLLPGLGHDYKL